MSGVYAMVLAGGVGSRLASLTEQRAKPAVPFGGKYRIIDFVLSNLANSGMFDVGVLTQYRPLSLIEHVGTGRTWDLDRSLGGLQILQPYLEAEAGEWYRGTADAVYRNLMQVRQRAAEDVLILSGDHVYAMDYREILAFHQRGRFPATVALTPVPREEISQFGIVETNAAGQIVSFKEKPKTAESNLASMGIYVFRRDILIRLLEEDAEDPESAHDFGRNIFPKLIRVADVGGFVFDRYWRDIGTVEAYYEANMRFTAPEDLAEVIRPNWPTRTPSVEAPPAWISGGGRVRGSLVANGAVVRGSVENSILFPGVIVEEGAVVRESVLMNGCQVRAHSRVERAILDKRVEVGENTRLGGMDAAPPNEQFPDLFVSGITLLGKDVALGADLTVGRNVCIGGGVRVGDAVGDSRWIPGQRKRAPASS